VYSYGYVFNGFAAELTDAQAAKLKAMSDVVKRLERRRAHARHEPHPGIPGSQRVRRLMDQLGGQGSAGEDIVIGMVDSGFWPENPSSDRNAAGKLVYHNIPHWKGKCHPCRGVQRFGLQPEGYRGALLQHRLRRSRGREGAVSE
jgi:hypothetical protein